VRLQAAPAWCPKFDRDVLPGRQDSREPVSLENLTRIMLVEEDLHLGAALHRAFELSGFEPDWAGAVRIRS
jgi:hypothetical protein